MTSASGLTYPLGLMRPKMEVVYKPRGSGKTTQLIKMAAESFGTMVVYGHQQASYVADLAKRMGLDIPYPITYREFLGQEYRASGIICLLVDDLESLVEYIASLNGSTPIHAVAMSQP